jgi:trans-aconitate methyltransferase
MQPDDRFMAEMRALEPAYLESDDPLVQSGFSGGRARWYAERSPLIEAIDRDGSLLDVGCANGLLLADVTIWAQERGYRIVPYGIDLGGELVRLARERLSHVADNLQRADAWNWTPQRSWTFVYSLIDLTPPRLQGEWLSRLYSWVSPGGRLIVGSYGSRSRKIAPVAVAALMERHGFDVVGSSDGGEGPMTRFAWVERTTARGAVAPRG